MINLNPLFFLKKPRDRSSRSIWRVRRFVCRDTGVSTIISSSILWHRILSSCSIRHGRVGQCYCLSRTRTRSGWSIVCCLAQVVIEGWFDDEIIWNLGTCVQFKFFFERMVPISSKWFSKNWTIKKLNVEVEEHLYRVLKIHLHAHFSFPPAAACTLPWSISKEVGRRPLLKKMVNPLRLLQVGGQRTRESSPQRNILICLFHPEVDGSNPQYI